MYKVYFSRGIEYLIDEELIGEAETVEEATKLAAKALDSTPYKDNPYWRFLMGAQGTFIDYGSYSKYIAIIPPLTPEDIK